MIVCSLVFYGWLRADYTLILIGSAGVNFAIATRLEQNRSKTLFGCGIVFNLLLLGVFKYADFAVANGNILFGVRLDAPAYRAATRALLYHLRADFLSFRYAVQESRPRRLSPILRLRHIFPEADCRSNHPLSRTAPSAQPRWGQFSRAGFHGTVRVLLCIVQER